MLGYPAEQLNRGVVILRKMPFVGSGNGGQNLAIQYSFTATCKANGIPSRKWLKDALSRLSSTSAGDIDSQLPHL